MMRIPFDEAVERSGILEILASLSPHLAGTPPLGLALETSDIDILCHAPDTPLAVELIWRGLAHHSNFRMHQWREKDRPVIAAFTAFGWDFEVFASPVPVADQAGWRHFTVEKRLLALGGETLRQAIMQHRHEGLKTEPAFARALGLVGDPYAALLELSAEPDAVLARLLRNSQ